MVSFGGVNRWSQEQSSDVLAKVFCFIISPLLGLLVAIRRINTKSSFVIFFLFAVFFGLSFTTVSGRDDENKGDATQYRMRFEYMSDMTQNDLRDVFFVFQSFQDERNRDIYVPIMTYLTSRITNNYHVFFALLACVFAYFSLRSFKFFSEELPGRKNIYVFILLYIFVFSNSIFNINGCRFWTAAWIAVYSIFQIFKNGNKRYYLLAAITPLVHASYWFFLGILIIAQLFGKRIKFWKIAFFLSFIFSSLSMQLVVDLSDYLPSSLQFLVDRYTEGEHELKTNLYQVISRLFGLGQTIVLTCIMYLFMKNERRIMNNPKTTTLYSFLLVWMTICNFVMPIPSLGGRYIVLGMPLIAYIWYLNFESCLKYRETLVFYIAVSLLPIYELIVCYLQLSVPISFYVTSPLYQFYKYIILGVV